MDKTCPLFIEKMESLKVLTPSFFLADFNVDAETEPPYHQHEINQYVISDTNLSDVTTAGSYYNQSPQKQLYYHSNDDQYHSNDNHYYSNQDTAATNHYHSNQDTAATLTDFPYIQASQQSFVTRLVNHHIMGNSGGHQKVVEGGVSGGVSTEPSITRNSNQRQVSTCMNPCIYLCV